jgi:hypothetical protein
MADRSACIGICKSSFNHSCEGQLPKDLIVCAIVGLVLKDLGDPFFCGRHDELALKDIDSQAYVLKNSGKLLDLQAANLDVTDNWRTRR